MEARVIRKFKDKYTNKVYRAGSVIELSENRFNEIQAKGNFLERLEDPIVPFSDLPDNLSDKESKAEEMASTASGDKFSNMTMNALRHYADQHFKITFAANTRKADMLAEIRRREYGN